jgi:hypothetical protein
VVNAKVHPHASGGLGLFNNGFIEAKRNEIPARRVATQCLRGGFRGEVSAPFDLEPSKLGNRALEAKRSKSRLGRSLKHLIEVVNELMTRKIGLKSFNDPIDTTTRPAGPVDLFWTA